MEQGGGFDVDLAAVRKIAARSDALGNEIVELATFTADTLGTVEENHPGWAVSSALSQAQAVCGFNVEGFGRWVCDVGDRLSSTGRRYQDSDAGAASDLAGARAEGSARVEAG